MKIFSIITNIPKVFFTSNIQKLQIINKPATLIKVREDPLWPGAGPRVGTSLSLLDTINRSLRSTTFPPFEISWRWRASSLTSGVYKYMSK